MYLYIGLWVTLIGLQTSLFLNPTAMENPEWCVGIKAMGHEDLQCMAGLMQPMIHRNLLF